MNRLPEPKLSISRGLNEHSTNKTILIPNKQGYHEEVWDTKSPRYNILQVRLGQTLSENLASCYQSGQTILTQMNQLLCNIPILSPPSH